MILIQTRWHEDDLAGRLLKDRESENTWEVLSLPALAEPIDGGDAGDRDELGRTPGEALCPERFDRKSLMEKRKSMGSYSFAALYQQNPMPRERRTVQTGTGSRGSSMKHRRSAVVPRVRSGGFDEDFGGLYGQFPMRDRPRRESLHRGRVQAEGRISGAAAVHRRAARDGEGHRARDRTGPSRRGVRAGDSTRDQVLRTGGPRGEGDGGQVHAGIGVGEPGGGGEGGFGAWCVE